MRMLRLRFSPLPDSIARMCIPQGKFARGGVHCRETLLVAADGLVNGGDELNREGVVIALIAEAVVLVLVAGLDELKPARPKTCRRFKNLGVATCIGGGKASPHRRIPARAQDLPELAVSRSLVESGNGLVWHDESLQLAQHAAVGVRPVHIYANTARRQRVWIRFAREKVRIVAIKVWTAIARRSNAEPLAKMV